MQDHCSPNAFERSERKIRINFILLGLDFKDSEGNRTQRSGLRKMLLQMLWQTKLTAVLKKFFFGSLLYEELGIFLVLFLTIPTRVKAEPNAKLLGLPAYTEMLVQYCTVRTSIAFGGTPIIRLSFWREGKIEKIARGKGTRGIHHYDCVL